MPYRTLPTDFHLDVRYSFTSSGPDPKAEIICGIQYSLEMTAIGVQMSMT